MSIDCYYYYYYQAFATFFPTKSLPNWVCTKYNSPVIGTVLSALWTPNPMSFKPHKQLYCLQLNTCNHFRAVYPGFTVLSVCFINSSMIMEMIVNPGGECLDALDR